MKKHKTSTKSLATDNVGNVKISYLDDPDEIHYADGAEKDLLDIFTSANPKERISEILGDNPSWPMVYHLSSKRSTLVDWYDFEDGSRVLEIGAGCGAITEALLNKPVSVTALEIDPVRARVNAERNKLSSNLNVVVGNIENFYPEESFDYVVCVGVLEYSGKYVDAHDPYLAFMQKMASFVKPQGKILVAIENKLGLKYFAGAKEDHTGILFDSLNNYPNSIGVQTFSRHALSQLFTSAGLVEQCFYYPHPDYKLPHIVFSDMLHPGKGIEFPLGLLPTSTPEPRHYLFSEQALATTLEDEELFGYFANSFLLEASKSGVVGSSASLTYIGQRDRKNQYDISTVFVEKDEELWVRKKANRQDSNDHIINLVKTSTLLTEIGLKHLPLKKFSTDDSGLAYVEYPKLSSTTLERTLVNALTENNLARATELVRIYLKTIDSIPTQNVDPTKNKNFVEVFGRHYAGKRECIVPGIVDLNLDNFLINEDDSTVLFDYEWRFDFPVPKEFILARMVHTFFGNKYSDLLRRNYEKLELIEAYSNLAIPSDILRLRGIDGLDFYSSCATDNCFQNYVSRQPVPIQDAKKVMFKRRPVTGYQSFDSHLNALEDSHLKLDEVRQKAQTTEDKLYHSQQKLKRYENNLLIKVLRRARRLTKDAKARI